MINDKKRFSCVLTAAWGLRSDQSPDTVNSTKHSKKTQIRLGTRGVWVLPPTAGWVANNVDTDQTPRSAASDLGLHCLLRPVCPNT